MTSFLNTPLKLFFIWPPTKILCMNKKIHCTFFYSHIIILNKALNTVYWSPFLSWNTFLVLLSLYFHLQVSPTPSHVVGLFFSGIKLRESFHSNCNFFYSCYVSFTIFEQIFYILELQKYYTVHPGADLFPYSCWILLNPFNGKSQDFLWLNERYFSHFFDYWFSGVYSVLFLGFFLYKYRISHIYVCVNYIFSPFPFDLLPQSCGKKSWGCSLVHRIGFTCEQ